MIHFPPLWRYTKPVGVDFGGAWTLDFIPPPLPPPFKAYLMGLDLPREELEGSIIGTIGDMDSPMSPDAKGWTSLRRHLLGSTDETRQRFRDEVLSTKLEDFVEFGQRLEKLKSSASIAVVGSKTAFETYNADVAEDCKLEVIDPFSGE
ncbi:unnamed protein product [Ascophyllum nodosum]